MSLEINIDMLAATLRETNLLLNKLAEACEGMEFPKQGPKIDITPVPTRTRSKAAPAPAPAPAPTYQIEEVPAQAMSDSDWGDFEQFGAVEIPAPPVSVTMTEEKFMEEANRLVREIAQKLAIAKKIAPQEALKLVAGKIPQASGQTRLALVTPENRTAVLANISRLAI